MSISRAPAQTFLVGRHELPMDVDEVSLGVDPERRAVQRVSASVDATFHATQDDLDAPDRGDGADGLEVTVCG